MQSINSEIGMRVQGFGLTGCPPLGPAATLDPRVREGSFWNAPAAGSAIPLDDSRVMENTIPAVTNAPGGGGGGGFNPMSQNVFIH